MKKNMNEKTNEKAISIKTNARSGDSSNKNQNHSVPRTMDSVILGSRAEYSLNNTNPISSLLTTIWR